MPNKLNPPSRALPPNGEKKGKFFVGVSVMYWFGCVCCGIIICGWVWVGIIIGAVIWGCVNIGDCSGWVLCSSDVLDIGNVAVQTGIH